MARSDFKCPFCSASFDYVHRFGFFRKKRRAKKIQRYRCKVCRKTFSDATLSPEYRQKKRHLNKPLFYALTSSTGLRQSGRILNLNYKTVVRRLSYFDRVATRHTNDLLQKITPEGGFKHIHFDDMETSEHSKLKPLSIPMTVMAEKRFIIAFDVVSMPAKGHLAAISRKKYGIRPDHRKLGWKNVLTKTSALTSQNVKVTSDQQPFYPAMLKAHLPHKTHERTKGRAACVAGQGEMKVGGKDPLFSFNHSAAMIRAHVNRLHRRTWCTTKRPDRLITHLKMYQLWHNEKILAKLENRKTCVPFK